MIIHEELGVYLYMLNTLPLLPNTSLLLPFAELFQSFLYAERFYIYKLITEKSLKSKLRAYWTRWIVCNALVWWRKSE